MNRRRNIRLGGAAALAGVALLATGCATDAAGGEDAADETADAQGRVAVAYENGIAVLDGTSLEVIDEFESEEFTRLNAAGDGRHVMVSMSEGFQLLDTAEPALTDLIYPGTTPGHVVRHAGNTLLYDDGTGQTTIVATDDLAHADGELPETRTYTAPDPHHGVSIQLEDGTLLTTEGTEAGRSTAVALEADGDDWTEVARFDDCPGIHGEGTAQGEAVVFGCEDGALLYTDGEFEKLTAPDAYGRMGNAYTSPTSPIIVGDYNSDPDAEGYLLNAVTLIDTAAGTYEAVDLPDDVQFTYRDVARGTDDLAYILATDGSIHVLDPATGELVNEFPVVDAWEGPQEWQDAHPAIVADGDVAYVTEPAQNAVHAVDLSTGEITASVELEQAPNEMAIALGAH